MVSLQSIIWVFLLTNFSRVINLLLTKLARDRPGRISALVLFCTDFAALGPYCQDLGPIFSQYGPHAWLIRYIYIYICQGYSVEFFISLHIWQNCVCFWWLFTNEDTWWCYHKELESHKRSILDISASRTVNLTSWIHNFIMFYLHITVMIMNNDKLYSTAGQNSSHQVRGLKKIQILMLNTTTYTCHRLRPTHACDRY